ncbi:MAG: argininosuccinate synthase, partial [Acidimicrobiia bacterium]
MKQGIKKVVLAYSGGLDTSIILRWIIEEYGAEVVAYTADVGQGDEVDQAHEKALATGATEAITEDLTHEFVEDFVFPAVRSSALYEGYYLMGTSLARPVISKGLVRVAEETGADAIAHGATGKGNDQVRFELSAYALKPDIKVVAPWREWDMKGRADLVAYAERFGIPIPTTPKMPYSMDANILHISYEGGVLENPWAAPPPGMFRMTTDPVDAPDEPQVLTVGFRAGNPVSVDGVELDPVEILTLLNEIGGRHGVGRIDIVENRFVGMKSRGVYETPGGTIIYHAHRAVESLTLDREVAHLRDELSNRYAEMVYNGFWYSPEREALQAFMDDIQTRVNGEARLRLYKGQVVVEGRRSAS